MCSRYVFVWAREVRNWDQVLAVLQPSPLKWIVLRLGNAIREESNFRILKVCRKDMRRSKVSSDEICKSVSAGKG